MSKKANKRNKKYVVKVEQKNKITWEELKDLNLTIRKDLATIIRQIAKLKAIIFSNPVLKDDENIRDELKGVEAEIKDIKNQIDRITESHAKIEEKDGKKFYIFKAGEIDITNDKEYRLFQDAITGYSGLSQMIATLGNTAIIALSTSIAQRLAKEEEKEKKQNQPENNENNSSKGE